MKILQSECGAQLSSRWLSFWAMKTAQLASTVFLALIVLAIFAPIAQAQTTSTLLTAGAMPTAEGDDDGDGVANINDIDSNLFDPDADGSVSPIGGFVLDIPVGEDDPCYSWWVAKAETAATHGIMSMELCVSEPFVIPGLRFGTEDSDSDDSDSDDSDSDDSDDSDSDDSDDSDNDDSDSDDSDDSDSDDSDDSDGDDSDDSDSDDSDSDDSDDSDSDDSDSDDSDDSDSDDSDSDDSDDSDSDDSDSDDSDDSDSDDSDSDDSDSDDSDSADSDTGAEETGNGSGNDDTNNAAPPVAEVNPVVILPEPDPAPISFPGPSPAPTEPVSPGTVADLDTSGDTSTVETPAVDDERLIEVPVVEEPIVGESLEVEEGNESQDFAGRSSLPEEFETAASPGPQFVVEGSHPSFSASAIPNIEKIVDEIFGETERDLPQVPQLSASNPREPFFPSLGASIPKDPEEVDESGLPLRAVAAAAAIMLLMGSSAGAAAASSGRAVRWGLPGFVLTIVYRLAGAYRERRCQECGCALRYRGGEWVEKDSHMTHGIYDHVHSPSKPF